MAVPVCPGNDITILDPAVNGYHCKKCPTCPAGEGLSVNCGDVITSQTPVKCQRCVIGETYSGANEPGACKICHNCDELQETIKPCTLTSNAVCGNCTQGAYFDNNLGKCERCSPCCNDDRDKLEPGCKVAGVAANMQCNFARSGKCAKVAERKANKSPSPTQHPTPSTTFIPRPPTMYPTTKNLEKPSALSASAATFSSWIAVGAVAFGVFLVFLICLAMFYYCRKRKCQEKETGLSAEEIGRPVPDRTNEQELLIVVPKQPLPPVEETDQIPLSIQDSQLPARIDTTGNFTVFI